MFTKKSLCNTVTDKTNFNGITTITVYAPTAYESAGLEQASKVLDYIETLDSEAYGHQCLRESVLEQYRDILTDCEVVSVREFEQTTDEYLKHYDQELELEEMQRECCELFESTLPSLEECMEEEYEDHMDEEPPFDVDEPFEGANDAPFLKRPIGVKLGAVQGFKRNGDTHITRNLKATAEQLNVHSSNLSAVWSGTRDHTGGWYKMTTEEILALGFIPKGYDLL